MPSFVVYEVSADGTERPYAFVPDARDGHDALTHLRLQEARFLARESHRTATGEALSAQYRMRVRDVARRGGRRA